MKMHAILLVRGRVMKKAIVTVDTEGHIGDDPVRRLIWGETTDGIQCGIPLIMNLCDEVGAKALFFLDFAEAWHYGEGKIAEVAKYIVERGHNVGVHIHPDHMADPKRMFLHEYSYEEQYSIIKECTNLYRKILGKPPISFRAGKYGANYDTLNILAELGYRADYSEFYGYNKWCGIQPPVTGDETIRMNNDLIEVPTMSYENHFGKLFHRYDKLDIEMPLREQQYVLDLLLKSENINTIVMFIHSFSLINWKRDPNNPCINKQTITKMKRMLSTVATSDLLCFKNELDIINSEYVDMTHFTVPSISGITALFFMIPKSYIMGKKLIYEKIWNKRKE